MYRIRLRKPSRLLVLEQRIERIFQKQRVSIEEDREHGEQDIDRLQVAIRADFLEEEVRFSDRAAELYRCEGLTRGEGGDG